MKFKIYEKKDRKKPTCSLKLVDFCGYPAIAFVDDDTGKEVGIVGTFGQGHLEMAGCLKGRLEDDGYDTSGLLFNVDGSLKTNTE